MKQRNAGIQPLPPHLSMAEYADFVWENLQNSDRKQGLRQKEIEERITARFRFPKDEEAARSVKTPRSSDC